MQKGVLYIVATPIGNLGDVTLRAIEILKSVDCIYAEDTRISKKLLNKYEIKTQLKTYHAHTSTKTHEHIKRELLQGKQLALVSDAGTPAISDPGSLLIASLQEEVSKKDISIIPIPGPSALTTFLSVCPLDTKIFTFYGFIPQKKGRQTFLREIVELKHAAVFYESSHRILKLLEEINIFPLEDKEISIGRELTKMFEEIITKKPEEVLNYFKQRAQSQKGEFVVVLGKPITGRSISQ